MASTSAVYPPEIWANQSLAILSDNLVMARLVNRDFENEVQAYGDLIHTRKPTKLSVQTQSVQSATDGYADQKVTPVNLQATDLSISLNVHDYTSYLISDRESAISLKELKTEFLEPAVQPLAQNVDDAIMTEFCTGADYDGSSTVGNAAVTGQGAGAAMDEDDVTVAVETLNSQQCPFLGRSMVLCTGHHGDMLRADIMQRVDQSGSSSVLRDATVGRIFGFTSYMSQNVPVAADTNGTEQSLCFTRDALTLVVRPLGSIPPGIGASGFVASAGDISIRVVESYETLYGGIVMKFEVLYGVQLLDSNFATIINP